MKRREFIIGAGTTFFLAGRKSTAKPSNTTHAAVVIGVNKAGILPELSAAASGAKQFGDFLADHDYAVVTITDENNRIVRAQDVKDTIKAFIGTGTFKQLIIYFAGHGFATGSTELWLLSEAPADANQAINLLDSTALARRNRIPNVIFISDTCRSLPSNPAEANLLGSAIFPNPSSLHDLHIEVDQFLATRLFQPAFEAQTAADQFEGLFTSVFLSAFRDPPQNIVEVIGQEEVVPNRKLGIFLRSAVPAKAAKVLKDQVPDDILNCGPEIFIAPVRRSQSAQSNPPPAVGPSDFSKEILGTLPQGGPILVAPEPLNHLPEPVQEFGRTSGFEMTRKAVLAVEPAFDASGSFGTSFSVAGAGVQTAVGTLGLDVTVLGKSEGAQSTTIRVHFLGNGPGTIAIQFTDGSGTVLAALPEFSAEILVESAGVSNVSYTSVSDDFDRQQLRELRATVAAAASIGALRLQSEKEAERFGDRIRVGKGIDPTLGLYAAYAYWQAALPDKLNSVAQVMKDNLNALLFDVALLTEQLTGSRIDTFRHMTEEGTLIAPFCPMLTQGWHYLRAMNINYPRVVFDARSHLRPSLWTTYDREGMDMLLKSDIWG